MLFTISFLATLLITFQASGPSAFADELRPSEKIPNRATFLEVAIAHAKDLGEIPTVLPSVSAGETVFLPLNALIRGQNQVSVDNMIQKIWEHEAAKDIAWDAQMGRWLPAFDHAHDFGQSSVPIDDPITAIKGPQGLVLVDGHHDYYLALFLGTKTIAVNVKEDLSNLGAEEFWRTLRRRNLLLLDETPEELAQSLPKVEGVTNNPNRYLSALLAVKVKAKQRDGVLDVVLPDSVPIAVWIKVNDSVPFIEFTIAKILADAGIVYDEAWGKQIPPSIVEQARDILLASGLSQDVPILTREQIQAGVHASKSLLTEVVSRYWK